MEYVFCIFQEATIDHTLKQSTISEIVDDVDELASISVFYQRLLAFIMNPRHSLESEANEAQGPPDGKYTKAYFIWVSQVGSF